MLSDDTEHTAMVAQSLLSSRCPLSSSDSVQLFRRSLAWKLRLWLLAFPPAIGFATLRSIIKLWIGFSGQRSGVYSAGNGPAMRSAIIGAYFAGSTESINTFVAASTLLTHTDPRALTGALAIAHLAGWIVTNNTGTRGNTSSLVANIDTTEFSAIDSNTGARATEASPAVLAYHSSPIRLASWAEDTPPRASPEASLSLEARLGALSFSFQ
jgi:ADP-ribosylglycohydrolase